MNTSFSFCILLVMNRIRARFIFHNSHTKNTHHNGCRTWNKKIHYHISNILKQLYVFLCTLLCNPKQTWLRWPKNIKQLQYCSWWHSFFTGLCLWGAVCTVPEIWMHLLHPSSVTRRVVTIGPTVPARFIEVDTTLHTVPNCSGEAHYGSQNKDWLIVHCIMSHTDISHSYFVIS